tara:strand:+ start:292 stop:498 length:207 start_codon:yes stop_codon:yes gene_type:complete
MEKPIINATFAKTDNTLQKNLELKKALQEVDKLRTEIVDLKIKQCDLISRLKNYKEFYEMVQKNLNEH